MSATPPRLSWPIRRLALGAVLLGLVAPATIQAQTDHFNLEEGLPTRVEDAYPTAFRNREFQVGPQYDRSNGGKDRFLLNPRLEIGPFRNAELGITVPVFLGSADKTGSGDIRVDALYNFNTESLALPALAVAARADFPTGIDRRGVDAEFKLLATRSIGNRLDRLHLNVIYMRAGNPGPGERRDRYAVILGYSGRLGPDMILVANVLRELERDKGIESNLVELGVRRQVTPLLVVALGAGAGIGDESPDVRVTAGLQYTLTLLPF